MFAQGFRSFFFHFANLTHGADAVKGNKKKNLGFKQEIKFYFIELLFPRLFIDIAK